ncbi:MAG TPA: AAA family ATPase [Polyangiaceae bacterium]|nr:AAA family ATPase [Polyangiaceae bacterium]
MIDRVSFENFKSLENVSLDLGRLTVLVGQNGSGKSSVLQGIYLLSQMRLTRMSEARTASEHLRSTFSGARDPRRLVGRERPTVLRLGMRDSGGDEISLTINIPAQSDDEPFESGPRFSMALNGPLTRLSSSIPSSLPREQNEALKFLKDARVGQVLSVVYLHLDANEMARMSSSEDEVPRMREDGSGLASTLAWMKGAAEDELAGITSDLARIVPGVKRIRTRRARLPRSRLEQLNIDGQPVWRPVNETVLGDRFEIEFDEGPPVPADLLSEGTVLALGLLTKLREPGRPRLVLLDDIDRGLHIEAQANFVRVLRDLMKLDPELQIVCTTHSPYLLDLFEPDEVRVLALDSSRRTRALPLKAHPEFDKWKFGTQTGELWAALGSAWVVAPPEPTP